MFKVFALTKRKSGMTQEAFFKHWEEVHGPLVKLVPGVRRYVQNRIVAQSGEAEPQFDGVAEVWFDDEEARRKAMEYHSGDGGKAIRDDEELFVDRSKVLYFNAHERVIKE